ncbi:MAG: hypothetical protein Q9200_003857 [Gallowayella weberi]
MASATRISGATTGQFDQVTAVSQTMINDQLQTLMDNVTDLKIFDVEPTTWDKSTLTMEDALLKPCSVVIPVEQNDFSTVEFYINFDSGTMKYDVKADTRRKLPAVHEEYPLAGWVVCFNVKMGLANVDPEELPRIKEQINVAGDYSIQRLFFDFTTADIANFLESKSKFFTSTGPIAYKDLPKSLQPAFSLVLNKWVEVLQDQVIDICYHGTAPDKSSIVNPIAPSFPPEDVLFQTYPFKNPNGAAISEADKSMNALLYLETCIKPVPTNTLLNWTGNFITNGDDGKANVNGSMFISRKLFFERFLLPLLKEFNLRSQITPTSAKNWIDGLMFKFQWGFMSGWDPAHTSVSDSYYDWTSNIPNRKFTWSKTKADAKDNAGSTGFMRSRLTVKGDTTNELSWEAGGHELTLKVKSHYRQETWNEQIGITNDTHVDVNVGFTMLLVFQSISKGVLQINTYYPLANGQSRYNTKFSDAVWTTGDTSASSIWDSKPADKQQDIKNRWIASMGGDKWFTERMKNVLSAHRFVFPGNGTFSFSDPMFNKNGDLIVSLAYDGLTKPPLTSNIGAAPNVPTASKPEEIVDGASIKKK